MLNFILKNDGTVGQVTTDYYAHALNRNDFKTFERAQQIADQANAVVKGAGYTTLYLATDAGSGTSPRYDVIEAFKLGEPVSYGFNGDCYPCGHITKISSSHRRIETSEGRVFFRRKQTGNWKNSGTWFLVSGHHSEQNPSF